MKFMMLMIPGVYRGNKKLDGFTPDPKKMEEMGRFNEEMGQSSQDRVAERAAAA